jgi:hypothetical protein
VTKGDPSDGDYDRIARYEQGVMIALVIFAAAFLAQIVWLGWMILLFPTIAVAWRSGGRAP